MPHVVVTYRPPARVPEGPIELVFGDGVERQRSSGQWRAAGDGAVALGGGAGVARKCLAAGLVDEIQLHVVPVVLDGPRLLDGIDAGASRRLRCRSTGLRSP